MSNAFSLLLTKDIKGTITPIVINSNNEFTILIKNIKINFLFVFLFKYEINSNILFKYFKDLTLRIF